jgi:hypothetical protein
MCTIIDHGNTSRIFVRMRQFRRCLIREVFWHIGALKQGAVAPEQGVFDFGSNGHGCASLSGL